MACLIKSRPCAGFMKTSQLLEEIPPTSRCSVNRRARSASRCSLPCQRPEDYFSAPFLRGGRSAGDRRRKKRLADLSQSLKSPARGTQKKRSLKGPPLKGEL